MKKRISVGDKSVCFGLPVLKGQCPRWASPPLFPQGWLNWLHFFKEWTQSLNKQINYKWFKNKPKNLTCNNEIKGFKKNNCSMESRPGGLAPAVGDGMGPGKGTCADPLCGEGFAASSDIPPPMGRAQKMPSECKLQEVGHPFLFLSEQIF